MPDTLREKRICFEKVHTADELLVSIQGSIPERERPNTYLYDNDGNPILGFDLREEKLTDGSTVLNLYLKADR
jgi:hypothetical protein